MPQFQNRSKIIGNEWSTVNVLGRGRQSRSKMTTHEKGQERRTMPHNSVGSGIDNHGQARGSAPEIPRWTISLATVACSGEGGGEVIWRMDDYRRSLRRSVVAALKTRWATKKATAEKRAARAAAKAALVVAKKEIGRAHV